MSRYDVEDAESRSWSLGGLARTAQRLAPGIVQTAANPWGMAVTMATRHARRVLGSPGRRPPLPSRGVIGPASTPIAWPGSPAMAAPAAPMPALAADSANPAATLLLALLKDPRLLEACAALATAPGGARQIPLDGTVAPPAAWLNAVSHLAVEASQAATTDGAPVDGYLRGPDGSYLTDIASPAARARVLLDRLQAEAARTAGSPPVPGAAEQWLLESGLAELVWP